MLFGETGFSGWIVRFLTGHSDCNFFVWFCVFFLLERTYVGFGEHVAVVDAGYDRFALIDETVLGNGFAKQQSLYRTTKQRVARPTKERNNTPNTLERHTHTHTHTHTHERF